MPRGPQLREPGGVPGDRPPASALAVSLEGFHSDNGVEFLNSHLVGYCQQEQFTFMRSRPHKKNDQAYVEQKNCVDCASPGRLWSLEGQPPGTRCKSFMMLSDCTSISFQPSMKLLTKERTGDRVKKTYDAAKTPSQRVLADEHLTSEVKARFTSEYLTLDPVALLRKMHSLQAALWDLAISDAAMPAVQATHSVRGENIHQAIPLSPCQKRANVKKTLRREPLLDILASFLWHERGYRLMERKKQGFFRVKIFI